MSAGLGALDGPLHGSASGEAHRMLRDAAERGSDAVVADHPHQRPADRAEVAVGAITEVSATRRRPSRP